MGGTTLHDLFHEASVKFTNNNCVTYINENYQSKISYAKMECTVKDFCDWWKSINEETNCFVGILSEEFSIEVIVILIGVMEVGNSFVFVDPTCESISEIVQRLNIRYFIGKKMNLKTQLSLSFSFISSVNVPNFSECFNLWKCNILQMSNSVHTVNIAFAVFSSGTTGTPKIIQVPHLCLLPNIVDLRTKYKLQPTDTVYISTAPTFDPCILDIFLALSTGSSLLLAGSNIKYDQNFLSKIMSETVTLLYMTPSLFLTFFPKNLIYTSLKILILGGEPFPKLDFQTWSFLKNVQVFNIYGITEVSCWASVHLVTNFEDVPLGEPLAETIFEVRRYENVLFNDGEGELFIGSDRRICLINDESHSAGITGLCFRATGDIVRFSNNKYYYIGRKDRRIKLFGNLVDLSFIEMKVSNYSQVKRCCCIFIHEENRIAVLVESYDGNNVIIEDLETHLKTELSSFAIPGDIFNVHKIPVNKHGKICQKSCRELYDSLKFKFKNDITSEFRKLWIKYTNDEDNKLHEDLGFLDSGGSSMLALQFSQSMMRRYTSPDNFIAMLLSNKNYCECLQLMLRAEISNRRPADHQLHISAYTSAECNRNLNKIDNDGTPSKRLKIDTGSNLLRVICKSVVTEFSRLGYRYEEIAGFSSVKVKWKHNLRKCVDASPTLLVFENRTLVACGSHAGHLLLIDVKSGSILSQFNLPGRIESSACSSETGEFIYVGCYDHKLYCCNIKQNIIEWSFKTNDMVKSTPVYYKEKIYFGSYDHNFYCLFSSDGSLIWKVDIDKTSIYAAALVNEDFITVVTLGGTVAFLNHNGEIKHKFSSGKPFFASPCSLSNNLLVVIDVTGVLRLLNSRTFLQLWLYQVNGNVFSSITTTNYPNQRIIFGCHDKSIYCFEITANSGNLCWRTEVDFPVYSTPFCCQYLGAEMELFICVVTVTTSGTLFILNALNGSILMSQSIHHPVFSSPVVSTSSIIVGCRDDNLYCLEIS